MPLVSIAIPRPLVPVPPKFSMMVSSMLTAAALTMRMPLPVNVLVLCMTRPRSVTTMLAPLTMTPFVLAARMPPCSVWQSIVIDLVMLTVPKPAACRDHREGAERSAQ